MTPEGTDSPGMLLLKMFFVWPIQAIIDNWSEIPGILLEGAGLFVALLAIIGLYMLVLYPIMMVGRRR